MAIHRESAERPIVRAPKSPNVTNTLIRWGSPVLAATALATILKVAIDVSKPNVEEERQSSVPPQATEIPTPPAARALIGGENYIVAPIETPTQESSPTTTPTTAPATATATATPVAPLKASSEKVFLTGLVERYGMVTEKNFDNYFSRISKEEMQQLIKEQPDLILFPFIPLSEQFSIGETQSTSSIDGQKNNHIIVYSPHLSIIAGTDGKLDLLKQRTSFYGLNIVQDVSEKTIIYYQNSVLGANSKLKPEIDAPVWTNNDTRGVPVKKGQVVAEFFGSDAFDNGKYSGPADQIKLSFYRFDKLDKPVKIGPGNLTITAQTTDLTPSLSNLQSWVHTKDGKIAILQP